MHATERLTSTPPSHERLQAHESYNRYHIDSRETPEIEKWPTIFQVEVKKLGLAKLLMKELIHYKGDMSVILSRPCMYGVFGTTLKDLTFGDRPLGERHFAGHALTNIGIAGKTIGDFPVGGFAPREHKCVGCLRCTTQYPDFVSIAKNPARKMLGDSYFTSDHVDAISIEAHKGNVPVRGAGYRGRFTGSWWDSMLTDMSEIVRPTRDGIHGREFISTVVDIGGAPHFLQFDEKNALKKELPHSFSLPIPLLFDAAPSSSHPQIVDRALVSAAEKIDSLAFLSLDKIEASGLTGRHVVPILSPKDLYDKRPFEESIEPRLVEFTQWQQNLATEVTTRFPTAIGALRTPFGNPNELLQAFSQGCRVFHLVANYHGMGPDGRFVYDHIREAHKAFVGEKVRDQVTLIGSGGMIGADHIPKAIIAGLDAVALDTAPLVAMQGLPQGEALDTTSSSFYLPSKLTHEWAAQRVVNMTASWRDQLLEILGAMGIREVRRLRGEMGRAMFHRTLEEEALGGIEGFWENRDITNQLQPL